MSGTAESDDPKAIELDALDAVSTAAKVWKEATAARAERNALDRAIVRAFDAGRTGTEIAAASGLDLALVFRVHKQADQIKSDDALTESIAENNRALAEMAARSRTTTTGWSMKTDEAMKRMLQRMPADAEVMRQISPDQADRMIEFYENHKAKYGL